MRLLELGVKPNDIVAIMMERSCEMVIAMIAILKVGAAYLPIAPNQPGDRISYMLNDSHADIVIVDYARSQVSALDEHCIIDLSKENGISENNPQ